LEPRSLPNSAIANRWLIALAAVLMQLCLGAVYAWSVFIKPLVATQPWSLVQVSATFTIAMASLGIGTVVGGLWQDRVGPRAVATVAGIFYGCGFLVSAWAVEHHSLFTLWAGYGLMSGLGMGMGYICPVATITKWFPDLRGVMTGAAVMGFGAGAVVMSKIAARIVTDPHRVPFAFETFGVAYLILVIFAAQFLKNPPYGWVLKGWTPRTAVARTASLKHYTVSEALRTGRFWLLWLLISLNTSAGISIISQASPLAQQQLHISEVAAATIVAMISVFNATGRVFWAWISDLIGRAQTYFTLFAIQVFLFFILPSVHDELLFSITVCAIALCYGGGFGVMPSFAADYFGSTNIGGIYGWILLGWGFAAIPSPLLIARVRETTGTYEYAIYAVGFLMLVALIFPLIAARITSRQRAEASAGARLAAES
jgi:MFS transporter, OFA family, oxalate/formate antiporter